MKLSLRSISMSLIGWMMVSLSFAQDQDFEDTKSYVIEFFDNLILYKISYFEEYSSYFVTHSFDISDQFSSDILDIYTAQDGSYAEGLSTKSDFVTALLGILTEFPWFDQFSATATVPFPSKELTKIEAATTTFSAQLAVSTTIKSTSPFISTSSSHISHTITSSNFPTISISSKSSTVETSSVSGVLSPAVGAASVNWGLPYTTGFISLITLVTVILLY